MEEGCVKCGYSSEENRKKNLKIVCKFCYLFSPDDLEKFNEYISEKVDGRLLDTFRKFFKFPGERQKEGMVKKAILGKPMSRPAFGYEFKDGKLVPAQNFREIEEIFEEFLNNRISLRKLAEKRGFSVNGLKKILRNFTYIGKIKFDNQIHEGNHEGIISTTLFNHVQNKLDRLKIK